MENKFKLILDYDKKTSGTYANPSFQGIKFPNCGELREKKVKITPEFVKILTDGTNEPYSYLDVMLFNVSNQNSYSAVPSGVMPYALLCPVVMKGHQNSRRIYVFETSEKTEPVIVGSDILNWGELRFKISFGENGNDITNATAGASYRIVLNIEIVDA